MIEFKISAPNKISLFGEHTGGTSLTASLNLRTTLTFTELRECPETFIILECHELSLHHYIPFELFNDYYRNLTNRTNNNEPEERIYRAIACNSVYYASIIFTFVNLLSRIAESEQINIKPFRMELSTALRMDPHESLGSYTACMAAGFVRWSNLQKGHNDPFNDHDINKIYNYARESNLNIPVADLLVCTYGRTAVEHNPSWDNPCQFINIESQKILISISDHWQDQTGAAQREVIEYMSMHPEYGNFVLVSISKVTEIAAHTLRILNAISNDPTLNPLVASTFKSAQHKVIMNLININQELLELLIVPHTNQNMMCLIARQFGVSGKYTNSSGKKVVYIWCPQEMTTLKIHNLSTYLESYGFIVLETNISCEGIRFE